MDLTIAIAQKECRVSITAAAEKAVSDRERPLVAELVVTLACCVRKAINFRELRNDDQVTFITPLLGVVLVSGEHKSREGESACLLPPIKNWNAIAPRWLAIDYRGGAWKGDFGFSRLEAGQ